MIEYMSWQKNRIPRTQRKRHCEKPGSCLGKEGELIDRCNEAPEYKDYALPLSENACIRVISDDKPMMRDRFKERYISVSHKIDQTLADPYILRSSDNLDVRFGSFERELNEMIESPELFTGDNGRYIFHIEARVLEAYLGAFRYRAENGVNASIPKELIEMTQFSLANILDDFDGLYENIVDQVALKRTEVEIPVLLLRTRNPEYFTWPTLFREDASDTRFFNHDGYQVHENTKIRNQVKNTDYRTCGKKKNENDYDAATMMVIHQDVVNLDFRDGETHVTVVKPVETTDSEEYHEPYLTYEESPRFIAWGAAPKSEDLDETPGEYIQKIGGYKRDGLIDALVREARGAKLSIEELNMLNGASHYLMASIREKKLNLL